MKQENQTTTANTFCLQTGAIRKYCIALIICILPVFCTSQTKKTQNTNNTMENSIIISETKDNITYLHNIFKYDDIDFGYQPKTGKDDFYLMFDISAYSKSKSNKPKIQSNRRYMMYVNKVGENYQTIFRLESREFFDDEGNYAGHAHPSGEWHNDNELGNSVLNYYFSHREIIPEQTENIDISQWKPLITLSKNSSNQQHVLELTLTNVWQNTKHFEIDCTVLNVNNVLINGELSNYGISTHTLLFWQGRNEYFPEITEYYVQEKTTSSKTYTNGGKDVIELSVSNQFGETRKADYDFAKKVLEYYLEHKSEMEMNMKNKK